MSPDNVGSKNQGSYKISAHVAVFLFMRTYVTLTDVVLYLINNNVVHKET